MKLIKLTSFLLLVAFLAINSIAQGNITTEIKHSHPEYEKSLKDIQVKIKKADDTYDLAQETYKVTKEYDRTMEGREKLFFNTLQILFALLVVFGTGNYFYNNYISKKTREDAIQRANAEVKQIKTEILELQAKEMKKNIEANEKTIIEMITSKERDYSLRGNAKIVVINHKNTNVSIGFKKVLSLFDKFDFSTNMMDLEKLSDILSDRNISIFRNADLVIIENQSALGQWKIDFPKPTEEEIQNKRKLIDQSTNENQDDRSQNQALIIELANKICDVTAMVYYGPGVLLSNLALEDKQHLIAFAQSPSTLYSNIMNLLKFKDILEEPQKS